MITDCFVVVTASNERQVGAIVDGIEESLLKDKIKPVRREGQREGRWVLLDYIDVVVHVVRTGRSARRIAEIAELHVEGDDLAVRVLADGDRVVSDLERGRT